MTPPHRPPEPRRNADILDRAGLELRVDPEPVEPPRLRSGCVVGMLLGLAFGFVVGSILLAIVIANAWPAEAAPREAAHPTTEAPRDVSGLRDGASGPPLLGAPLERDAWSVGSLDGASAPTRHDSGAPSPEGGIGSVLVGGKATWCAPTPTHCQSWGDGALLGAMPSFDFGDEPFTATVCYDGSCVDVTVVSYCACGLRDGVPTVIDLSPAAFARLAPLSRGVIDVTVEIDGDGPRMTLPPTDVAP